MFDFDKLLAFQNRPLLIGPEKTITFGEYGKSVDRVSAILTHLGVKRSTRVALLGDNSEQYLIALLATIKLGAIACPLSTRLPELAIRENVAQLGCDYLLILDGTKIENLPQFVTVVGTDELNEHTTTMPVNKTPLMANQPATVLFTSGSSGKPKAVMHSLGNHYFNAIGANKNIPFGPDDRWLLSLPLYHIGGLAILFRALLGGGAIIIPKDRSDLLETSLRYGATHISVVPTQLQRMMKQGEELPSLIRQLKAVLLGGAPLPTALIDSAASLGTPLFTSYGLTEMASQVTTTNAADSPLMLHTTGRPLAGRELKLSEEGEILVRGKTLFLGYVDGRTLHHPADSNGWFATGDMGRLDHQGYLTVIGRKDSMFISGGENIHPEEIENALHHVEGVEEVVVVAMPDAEFGARPVAFVRFSENKRPGRAEMIDRLKKILPAFKIPDRFFDWPDDLGTGDIKTVRFVLLRRAVALTADER